MIYLIDVSNAFKESFTVTPVVVVDNIQVRFFEMAEEGLVWEAYGDFGQGDVHRQVRTERVKYAGGQTEGEGGLADNREGTRAVLRLVWRLISSAVFHTAAVCA